MVSHNLYSLLSNAAGEDPDAPFFVFHDTPVTCGEALDKVRRIASYMRKRGVEKNHTVLLNLNNCPEFIYALFASFQLGVVAVLTNPATGRHELHYDCSITKPSLAFTAFSQVENFKIDGSFILDPGSIVVTEKNGVFANMPDIIGKEPPLVSEAEIGTGEPAVIIFTSAMDGEPLGAPITHSGILESITGGIKPFREGRNMFMSVLPLFHSFGLISSLLLPLLARSKIFLIDRFSPKAIADLIRNNPVTVFSGVPAMYAILSKFLPPDERFPRMRIWISGGEAISTELQQQMSDRHGIDIRQGYGLTEASPIVSWNHMDHPNRIGSIGVAMPYNEVRINGNGNAALPASGEILVRGSNVIREYYNRKDKTAEFLRDGWLHTGDTGYIDADGYMYITGRKKDMIIRKGFNVYPKEVESLLLHHPSIENVRITGHIQRNSDSTFTEILSALIYRKSGQILDGNAVINWCHKNITPYKIPDRIEIR